MFVRTGVRLWIAVGLALSLNGAGVVLFPVADTSLVEAFPTNNLGAQVFMTAGTTQNRTRNRALMRFDPASQIPAGARITSAYLVLTATRQPSDGYEPTAFGLYRMRTNWNEGGKSGYPPTLGAPATTNETTWTHRLAKVEPWSSAGASATNDFAPGFSTQEFIYGTTDSPYTFYSTGATVADVQDWLDWPGENFGWLLKPLDEAPNFTARRFAAREDTNQAPALYVDYLAPPAFNLARITTNQFQLGFAAAAGQAYALEARTNLAMTNWLQVFLAGPFAQNTNLTYSEPVTNAARWYRLRSF